MLTETKEKGPIMRSEAATAGRQDMPFQRSQRVRPRFVCTNSTQRSKEGAMVRHDPLLVRESAVTPVKSEA